MTLRSVEHGGGGVTMGAYLAVMQVLGIEQDINLLGQADTLGRDLQDARLLPKTKPSTKLYAQLPKPNLTPQLNEPITNYTGFTSSQTLANLIEPATKTNG